MMSLSKMPPVVSKAARSLPKSEPIDCTLSLYGCRHDTAYTVLAHLRGKWSLGMNQKPDDFFAVYACDMCHSAQEGVSKHAEVTDRDILFALYRSLKIMNAHGVFSMKP